MQKLQINRLHHCLAELEDVKNNLMIQTKGFQVTERSPRLTMEVQRLNEIVAHVHEALLEMNAPAETFLTDPIDMETPEQMVSRIARQVAQEAEHTIH